MMKSGTYTVQEIQKDAEVYFANKDKGKGSGYKQYKRWEYTALRLMDENGYMKPNTYYFDELERHNKYTNQRKNAQLNDFWTELGPTYWNQTSGWNPGLGRLTSLAVDPSNTDHIIVGSDVGGVWRTTNEGNNWTSLTDNYNNLYVYSLAMDPSSPSTYYWGSSNGRIYKSTDSGATWTAMASAGNGTINKILIHPTNTNIMFVSSSWNGIYKSTNGGSSWSRVINDSNTQDIEFNTNDLNTVYASGKNVYRSTDLGDNFTEISGFSTGAKMIGVTEDDSDRVYILEESSGTFNGFYTSTNGGSSFDKIDHSGKNYFGFSTSADDGRGQAPRDMDIAVSPTDKNEVHIAGLITWKSSDGGLSFVPTSAWIPQNASSENIGYCHSDVDLLQFIGNTLYTCTDGGIFLAENTASVNPNYFRDISTGLGIKAMYKLGISQTSPIVISAGSQDNGTSFYTPEKGWNHWLGADGMETFVDKNNSSTLYGTSQNGVIYKSTNQGNSQYGISPSGKANTGNWITPFEQDPSDENTIYAGYSQVYKSTDGGDNWSTISQDFGKNLDHLKIAPSNNTIIYGAYGDKLYKGTNTNSIWSQLTGFSGNINSIAIHPNDPNKVAIATTSNDRVFVSSDGGSSWTSYRNNLPNFSALALVWQEENDGLYLGMNYGIYYIDNTINEWENFNNNLPNVIINELEINTADNRIYAATYGRGCWSSPVKSNTLSISENSPLNSIRVFPVPASDVINVQWDQGYETSLRLYNIQGQLVYFGKKVSLNNNFQINISNLVSGTYFLRANNEKGSMTKKVIIR